MENNKIDSISCQKRLEAPSGLVFFIELPRAGAAKSTVEVMQGKVFIRPKDFSEVTRVSFVVLKAMFPDAGLSVYRVNQILGKVGK